jgi:uncharacterized cofD-like protein
MTSPLLAVEHETLVHEGPKVVALGGGHGLAITLKAVQGYAAEITAVVAVADDGGSSGRLTGALGIPPPGDISRCLLALSPEDSLWSELFAYRFAGGDIADHSLGNLLLAALTEIIGDFGRAVDAAGRILKTVGRVVPVASEPAELSATAEGREIFGQAEITKTPRIESMSLGPDHIKANPAAISAIAEADQVILGPGSLFTSLLAVLMVPGIAEAWHKSVARRVFVLNLIDQDGETMGLSGADHLRLLAAMGGVGGPGVVVVHAGELVLPVNHQIVTVDSDSALAWGWDVARGNVVDEGADWPAHDPIKLRRALQPYV